ncbi:MAG: rhodanese-like domain-containing protein [Cyanobacteria bacterium P01_F01_bin.42]
MVQSAVPPQIPEIDVQSLQQKLEANDPTLQFIDVREPQELEIASISGFQSFPLSQYASWEQTIGEQLDPHAETYVLCHHGIRSAQMCGWLLQHGFTFVMNVAGGIDAYSIRVDESLSRY